MPDNGGSRSYLITAPSDRHTAILIQMAKAVLEDYHRWNDGEQNNVWEFWRVLAGSTGIVIHDALVMSWSHVLPEACGHFKREISC